MIQAVNSSNYASVAKCNPNFTSTIPADEQKPIAVKEDKSNKLMLSLIGMGVFALAIGQCLNARQLDKIETLVTGLKL